MVHDFFPQLNKDELGQKAGFLGSAFFAGNFVGSLMWGSISDHWGRRPVMLFGICGTIASELLFGFSQTFAWAIVARFLWGFLNGNIGVAKTYLSEICDDTNQAQGFSVIGTSSGVGRVMGSVVGGFLAQPASKYRLFELPFFCQFPYVLPVFVAVGIGLFSFTTGFCFLNETLPKAKEAYKSAEESDDEDDQDDQDDTQSTVTDIELISMSASESDSELITNENNGDTSVIRESDIDSDMKESDTEMLIGFSGNIQNGSPEKLRYSVVVKNAVKNFSFSSFRRKFMKHHKEQCITCCHCYYTSRGRSQSLKSLITSCESWKRLGSSILSNFKQILRLLLDRRVILTTVIYGLMGYAAIITNELFPLLMVTSHVHGGYEMDDNEIATLTMIAAAAQLVYQPIVFPRTVKLLGYRNLLRASLVVFACSCILLPWSNRITGPIDTISNDTGSGMDPMMNDSSNYDYCGRSPEEASVNEDSISRLPAKVWAVVLLALLAMIVSRASTFTSIMVMVNNSALPETRGLVNGIGQSLVAIARSIGPTNGALLFAWSESNGLNWPLNYHLSFELCFVVSMIILLVSLLLPKTIEKKRTE